MTPTAEGGTEPEVMARELWDRQKSSVEPSPTAEKRTCSPHRLYAWLRGYFWMPCPRCGRMFGGHEVRGSVPTGERGVHQLCCCSPYCDDGVMSVMNLPPNNGTGAPHD